MYKDISFTVLARCSVSPCTKPSLVPKDRNAEQVSPGCGAEAPIVQSHPADRKCQCPQSGPTLSILALLKPPGYVLCSSSLRGVAIESTVLKCKPPRLSCAVLVIIRWVRMWELCPYDGGQKAL